jgi:TIR domain
MIALLWGNDKQQTVRLTGQLTLEYAPADSIAITKVDLNRRLAKKLFISHSSKDLAAVTLLVDLLREATTVQPEEIRCTSLPGYKLDPGVEIATQLREDLQNCAVVLGLLSANSLESTYVACELGAAWGMQKTIVTILAPNTVVNEWQTPLSGRRHLNWNKQEEWEDLIQAVAQACNLTVRKPALYARRIAAILSHEF